MYFVFNELSTEILLVATSNSIFDKQRINNFVRFLHLLNKQKMIKGIIATDIFLTFNISNNYGIKQWLGDTSVKKTHKQFFMRLCDTKCNYVTPENFNSEFTITLDNIQYKGIGCAVAAENDYSMVSILTNKYWEQQEIKGQYLRLDEETNLIEDEKSINNYSKISDANIIENRVRQDFYNKISSGQDLWEQRELLFPDLIFCESVKNQLYEDPEKFHISQIIIKLQKMQEYFKIYDGIYKPEILGLNARTESDTVKSNEKLKNLRKIKKPNGEESYFYNHISFSGKYSGRIHFFPDKQVKKCYIGYIGRHLPTKRF